MKGRVLLLRAPASDSDDRYELCLRDKGYDPVCIPVLETVLSNGDELADAVEGGPNGKEYAGVVITSARACEAWKRSVRRVLERREVGGGGGGVTWTSTPFYVVGEATKAALLDVDEDVRTRGRDLLPEDVRGARQAGTAETLARFVLDDIGGASDGPRNRRLLYLTGDKNRDVLPKILAEGGLQLDSLQVYGTRGSSTFPADLDSVLASSDPDSRPWWIVFFAPSSAGYTFPFLQQHFAFDDAPTPTLGQAPRRALAAAIGPTTTAFLKDHLRLSVAVESPKPTAEDLAAAIAAYDEAVQ
ncbi:tetrapyrrole biosynthesis uroporphyrinogen III synthase [Punctularia strigosozonata HHB-11173 SS5]|uniref:tetrapyrrole biosynthesis uroporphyrinogen III synthase n=1 Tax=Punctularia strigosozonata (strain HHB-11173) TaxID=741275 RepID=UPI000441634F|nr:tetrapyrrole biosynthesis uroporphyrinogen III synthase [Punctularia strigosozonata HHB-11173 SS5]EIN05811.1 tetrapyrrole biosynthesis uroporphyrinogen III synthase [Punctularia strigosozonata HHB-11173 SS5]